MSKEKPSLPKGTRDFGPDKMIVRNFIISSIRSVFQKYGFLPLETPAMEKLSVLTGKYGDEGDQLLYKVLNSGDYLSKINTSEIKDAKSLTPKISERGLRYDLTVPFARFVVMHQHELTFPFKRFQIQPVWRADRPQKGRYREFYQCDADVVGTNSLLCEVEIILMITEVFEALGINDFEIKINNRKVLEGIAELLGEHTQFNALCVAIDKMDKIGLDKVLEELHNQGFSNESTQRLIPILQLEGNNNEKSEALLLHFREAKVNTQGIEEINYILDYLPEGSSGNVNFDIQLARGLSYYTGTIFEVIVNNASVGSVGGGGRYDNLTGVFGLEGISGVGFSFGLDRLYDVLLELGIFNEKERITTKVMIANFDEESEKYGFKILQQLRKAGISSELYPDSSRLKKQLNYADKKSIPYVILAGENEIKENNLTLKNMQSGTQEQLSLEELLTILK